MNRKNIPNAAVPAAGVSLSAGRMASPSTAGGGGSNPGFERWQPNSPRGALPTYSQGVGVMPTHRPDGVAISPSVRLNQESYNLRGEVDKLKWLMGAELNRAALHPSQASPIGFNRS